MITMLSLSIFLIGMGVVSSFHRFLEYEFNWWDGNSVYHNNGFSMSHFQLKMQSVFSLQSTSRLQLKEAYFPVRLYPIYNQTLINDCSHVLILAHLLISYFEVESETLESVISHYRDEIKIFKDSAPIHQEFTNHAWRLRETLNLVESSLYTQQNAVKIPTNITVVLSGNYFDSGLSAILSRYIKSFEHSRLIVPARGVGSLDLLSTFGEVNTLHPTQSQCLTTFMLMEDIPMDNFPIVFLNEESGTDLHLFERNLKLLTHGVSDIPRFYSFGIRRTHPIWFEESIIPGGYAGGNFAVGQTFVPAQAILCIQQLCAVLQEDTIIQIMNKTTSKLYHPLRCIDDQRPVTLRLCTGAEDTLTDCRSTILAPVHPRHPVSNSNRTSIL